MATGMGLSFRQAGPYEKGIRPALRRAAPIAAVLAAGIITGAVSHDLQVGELEARISEADRARETLEEARTPGYRQASGSEMNLLKLDSIIDRAGAEGWKRLAVKLEDSTRLEQEKRERDIKSKKTVLSKAVKIAEEARAGLVSMAYFWHGALAAAVAAAVALIVYGIAWLSKRKKAEGAAAGAQEIETRQRRVVQKGPSPAFMKTVAVEAPRPQHYDKYYGPLRNALGAQLGPHTQEVCDVLVRVLPATHIEAVLDAPFNVGFIIKKHSRQIGELLKKRNVNPAEAFRNSFYNPFN